MIDYTFNRKSRRYVAPSGKFVSAAKVRGALDDVIRKAADEVEALSKRLQAGEINNSEWFTEVSKRVKLGIVASGTLAAGGPHALTPKLLGSIGSRVREQFDYLYAFSREIGAGLPLDGRFLARARMYAESGRMAYEGIARDLDIRAGFGWEKRTLGATDHHCRECVSQAGKGWRPAGELKSLGTCTCLTKCRCSMQRSMTRPAEPAAMSTATQQDNHPAPAAFKGGGAKSGKGSSGAKGSSGKLSGGHWVTIHGHPAYIGAGGKVVAGGIPGHTHDAKSRKPSGTPVKLDRADSKMARAHVVKGLKAERIRNRAAGKGEDTSGVDHHAMAAHVKAEAHPDRNGGKAVDYRYEHGGPKSKADHEHLRQAEGRGGHSAVKVTMTPKVWTEGGETRRYYFGDLHPVATVKPRPEGKGHVVVEHDPYTNDRLAVRHEHRTAKGAHAHARRLATAEAKNQTKTTRLLVPHGKEAEVPSYGHSGVNHSTTFRTLHRGKGSSVGFVAEVKKGSVMGLLAMFREWTKRDRDELDEADFGEPPDGFPIEDQSDIDAAEHLIGKADDPEAVKKRVVAIAKRKGLTLPASWVADAEVDKKPAKMSDPALIVQDETGSVSWA